MGDQHLETCNGLEVEITICEAAAGSWQSRAEVDLGSTGRVVFEDAEKTYASAEEARHAAVELACANLGRSRVGKANALHTYFPMTS